MKKLIALIALAFMATFTTNAQTVELKAGYSYTNVILSPYSGFIDGKSGFTAGLVVKDLMLSDNIGFQPELLYSQKGASVAGFNISFDYFSLPLLLKFPMAESGVSILAGPEVSYLANTRFGGLFSYNGLFNKVDVGLAGGLEYQLAENIAIGGRYTYGLSNVNKDFDFGITNLNSIIQTRNTAAQVYLTFGFGSNK
jgi:opacity protein-like surface antigen